MSEFLIKKYELIFGLFKEDLSLLKKRSEIFTAVQAFMFSVFFTCLKYEKSGIPLFSLAIPIIFIVLSYFWLVFNRKSRLFLELRKEHLREVEKEFENLKLDIFLKDQNVFRPNASIPDKRNDTGEEFPPENFRRDYDKYKNKSTSKYECYIPILFIYAWIVFLAISIFIFLHKLLKIFHGIQIFTVYKSIPFLTVIGLALNFIGAIIIIYFLEFGISSISKLKKVLKWLGYLFFTLGFLFQIISLVIKNL